MTENLKMTMQNFLEASQKYVAVLVPKSDLERKFVDELQTLTASSILAKKDKETKEHVMTYFGDLIGTAMDLSLFNMKSGYAQSTESVNFNKALFFFIAQCKIDGSDKSV